MTTNGTLHTIDGRAALRFERQLAHPVEKVWKALTEPGQLIRWFPCSVNLDLRPGGKISFVFLDHNVDVPEGVEVPDLSEPLGGTVTELDPPRLFAYTWGDDLLRWELRPDERGCLLVFTHAFGTPNGAINQTIAARTAAGWHLCLDTLDFTLAGSDRWNDYFAAYVQALTPTPLPAT
jgi:uncharacterized protein YndB with AHSA1/START domain